MNESVYIRAMERGKEQEKWRVCLLLQHLPLTTVTAGDRRVHAGWGLSTTQDHTKPHKIMAPPTSVVIMGRWWSEWSFICFLGVNFAQSHIWGHYNFKGKDQGESPDVQHLSIHSYKMWKVSSVTSVSFNMMYNSVIRVSYHFLSLDFSFISALPDK